MSMITEQVEYLIKLSNKHPFDSNILTLQIACKKAADTIKQLAAKVRAENNVSQPCEDAISRQAALDCFTATKLKKFDFILHAREEIKKLPPVNPLSKDYNTIYYTPQPKTGHWIYVDECHEHGRCSECGYGSVDLVGGELWNFCPNCGCRMVEPQESEGKE